MCMKWSVLLILCLSIHQLPNRSQGLGTFVAATSDNPLLTFESLYTNGINSYLENDWARCISHLELALNDWHWWNENTARCRGRCYEEANSADLIFSKSEAYEFERVFEKMVINTLCLIKCKKQVFASRMDNAAVDVITDFKMKKPYDYLQLCYYKHGQIDNAANAAATFLATQPDHEVMQANINYYVEEGSLDIDTIVNLELGEYANEYIRGDKAYQQEKYTETIDHLEESLNLFWKAFEECRFGCENPFDQGWYPDFVSSLANHYTFTLRCKNACPSQLSNLYGEEIEDFVASIFNYLQYSYYKVGKLQKACEAVESYLVLVPDDPYQIRNKQFFWAQNGVKEKFFSPRKVVLNYKERLDYEEKLLNYIEENFIVLAESPKEDVGMPELSKETETIPSLSEMLLEIAQLLGEEGESRNPLDSNLRSDTSYKEEF